MLENSHNVDEEALIAIASSIAHEVRNGLTPVQGAMEMLLQSSSSQISAEDRDLILNALDSLRRTSHYTNSVVAVSSQAAVEFQKISLRDIVRDALGTVSVPSHISFEIGEELGDDIWIEGTEHTLVQMLANLFQNSIDAIVDDSGSVTVSSDYDPSRDRVRLHISDSGRGISPDQLSSLFKPFQFKKVEGGTGMGLAMAKGLMKQHNGDILVNSEIGKGSVFTLEFPPPAEEEDDIPVISMEEPAPQPEESPEPAVINDPVEDEKSLRGLQIVVVDDEDAILHLFQAMLTRITGKQPRMFHNPLEALEFLTRVKREPDWFLVDYSMNPMNGADFLRHVMKYRNEGILMGDPAQTVITSGHIPESFEGLKDEFKCKLLQKPFSMENLKRLLLSGKKAFRRKDTSLISGDLIQRARQMHGGTNALAALQKS